MQTIYNTNLKTPILLVKKLYKDRLAIVDKNSTLRVMDMHTHKVVGGFKTSLVQERIFANHVDVSLDLRMSAISIPKTSKSALFSVKNKSIVFKTSRHQGGVESVSIDPSGKYLVTGGEDGKVFAYNTTTAKVAFVLAPHSDYVTDIEFSSNSQWIATSSYDRAINLTNLATMKNSVKLRGHSNPIVKLKFFGTLKLLSADKEGSLIIWDIKKATVLKRLTKMHDTITSICISDNGHFLFVGSKLGYVALYDLEKQELIKQRFIKEKSAICSMAFDENSFTLVVGTFDGDINFYNTFGDEEELNTLVYNKAYEQFYKMLEDNPMLLYSSAYEYSETQFNELFNNAEKLLETSHKKEAQAVLKPFMQVNSKKAQINSLFRDFEQYQTFIKYIDNQQYPLAYSLANQYPTFKSSKKFLMLEKLWKKSFLQAQTLIHERGAVDQAREILSKFRGISDKTMYIQELFNNHRKFEYMKKIIGQKDFRKLFELVNLHPFLTQFDEYQKVLDYADKLYFAAHQSINEENFHKAEQYAKILENFVDYKEEAKEILQTISIQHRFNEALESDDLARAFTILEANAFLYENEKAQALEQRWNTHAAAASTLASKGDIFAINKELDDFMNINSKYVAMATIYQQAYITQLERAVLSSEELEKIEGGVRRYLAFFGLDESIAYFNEQFKRRYPTNIDLEKQNKGNLMMWNPKLIVENIIK